ncbi:MAG: hypothetical protein AAF771_03480 [Pseudomonadota bacterium]
MVVPVAVFAAASLRGGSETTANRINVEIAEADLLGDALPPKAGGTPAAGAGKGEVLAETEGTQQAKAAEQPVNAAEPAKT